MIGIFEGVPFLAPAIGKIGGESQAVQDPRRQA